jgi:hypothetical protein
VGSLLSICSSGKRLPARQWWEGECIEGPKHRRYANRLKINTQLFSPLLTPLTLLEGELIDLIDDFSEGRVQFAFVKVKDPNTTLPKYVLIGWVSQREEKVL